MKKTGLLVLIAINIPTIFLQVQRPKEFSNGKKIPHWFYYSTKVKLENPGNQFPIQSFGALSDSTVLQTNKIRAAI